MERGTEYGLEQVYNVIDSRYRSGKPLIVTTNLTLEELQNPEDTAHARIYDRLTEMCTPPSALPERISEKPKQGRKWNSLKRCWTERRAYEKNPICEKSNLTLKEAAAYSIIGINKLRDLTSDRNCRFVLWVDNKRLIKRRLFDQFIEQEYSI